MKSLYDEIREKDIKDYLSKRGFVGGVYKISTRNLFELIRDFRNGGGKEGSKKGTQSSLDK
jgi:hypothetical protein